MTQIAAELEPERPRRWRLYVPIISLALLAAIWSAIWFFGRAQVETAIADWRAQEALSGRTYDCADEALTGYPFRFQYRCTDLTIVHTNEDLRIAVPEAIGVAQAYRPTRMIFEVKSPGQIVYRGAEIANAEWSLLQASLSLSGLQFDRLSVVADAPVFTIAATPDRKVSGTATRIAFHARRMPEPVSALPLQDFDVAIRADAIAVNGGAVPWTGSLDGAVTGVPPTTRLSSAFWRAWQAADGEVELKNLTLTDDNTTLVSTGALRATPDGALNGEFDIGMATKDPATAGGDPTAAYFAMLTTAAGIFGSAATVNGVEGRAVELKIEQGAVALGAMQLGVLPRLF